MSPDRGLSVEAAERPVIGLHTPVGTLVKLMGGGPILTVSGIAKPTPERLDYALETVWINEAGEVKSLVAPFACFALYGPQYD